MGKRRGRQSDEMEAAKEAVLVYVAAGDSIAEACRKVSRSVNAYQYWRASDEGFRRAVDELRFAKMPEDPGSWNGDFASFRKVFFGFDTYWHQRQIVRAVEQAKPLEPVMIRVPPEHGKTTLMEDFSSYSIATDPDHRITYATAGASLVRKIIRRIKGRMADPRRAPAFVAKFGPFYVPGQERQGKPWAADYFSVYQFDQDERDYSFEGRGWNSEVQGTRCDSLYGDDLQSLKTLNLSQQIVDRIRQDFFSRPGRHGRIVLLGTSVGIGDVWDTFLEQGLIAKEVRLPALDAQGKSLCPEMWSEEDLAKKRELVGEPAWWRNYMQQPRSGVDATFLEEVVDGVKDLTRCWGEASPGASLKIVGVDPALVGPNAIMCTAAHADRLEVLEYDWATNLGRVEAILARIEQMAIRQQFQVLVVETNAYQRSLAHDERLLELGRRYGFMIVPHETGSNKTDQTLGIAALPSYMVGDQIRFPDGDERTRERMRIFYEEMRGWRPDTPARKRRQDVLMAFWFCWLEYLRRRGSIGQNTSITRGGLPWSPTGLATISGLARPTPNPLGPTRAVASGSMSR